MRGYFRGMLFGCAVGTAAAMVMWRMCEPRSARAMMRRGRGMVRSASRMVRNWPGM